MFDAVDARLNTSVAEPSPCTARPASAANSPLATVPLTLCASSQSAHPDWPTWCGAAAANSELALEMRRALIRPVVPASAPPALIERQIEVPRQVREIAAQLGVGERTVKDHLSIVFIRLGVGNRAEAVAQAGALGLIQFDSAE